MKVIVLVVAFQAVVPATGLFAASLTASCADPGWTEPASVAFTVLDTGTFVAPSPGVAWATVGASSRATNTTSTQ